MLWFYRSNMVFKFCYVCLDCGSSLDWYKWWTNSQKCHLPKNLRVSHFVHHCELLAFQDHFCSLWAQLGLLWEFEIVFEEEFEFFLLLLSSPRCPASCLLKRKEEIGKQKQTHCLNEDLRYLLASRVSASSDHRKWKSKAKSKSQMF